MAQNARVSDRTVAVLAGGLSHEREVSLRSGRRLAGALRANGVDVREWDVDARLLERLSTDRPDAVAVALHGGEGENGAVQQVLELDQVTCDAPGFDDAVERAEARIRAESGSAASCARVDDQTVVATFTPLSEDAAERADEHFASFLSALEHELSALSGQGHDGHDAGDGVHDARKPASSGRRRRKRHTTDEPPASSKKVPLQQGKRAKRAKRGATKSPKSKKAPASEPRGKRAPTERSSETRSRNARGNKKKTRRNG